MHSAPPRAAKQRSPWRVPVGAGVANAVAPSTMYLATLGLFVLPIVEETGFSRTTITGSYSVAAVGMAIGLLLVGQLIDRYAVRYVLVPSFVLYAVSMAMIGLMPPIAPAYLIPCFFVGFFGAGTVVPCARAVVTWFDNNRALAIGVVTALVSLGSALNPLLAGALIDNFGWRSAYALMALVSVAVSVPAVLLLVRARAEQHVRGRLVRETEVGDREVSLELPGLTFREALRTRHFWLIALGLGLAGTVIIGLQVHLVPMMTDRGLSTGQAETLLVVFGLASLVGRLAGGFIIDRVRGTVVGPIVILAPIAGLFFLHPPFPSAVIAVAFIGVAFGIEGDLLAVLISRYLGTRQFGRILGVVQAAFLLGTAFGPFLLGLGYDLLGSYDPITPVLAGALVAAAVLIGSLGRYTYPPVAGFDRLAAEDELAASEVLSDIAEGDASHGSSRSSASAPTGA
ncbi:MFS transporter [Marinitenerispora sediminis]|uniref:MFS transporter n=2 Tax=Marinitenerispora sediminis TaxID=1931232 RepID=A0A368T4D2_9ACTN|nr:MFS transporter [Marinitenerispora sediminis]RCV49714.1 MFS transporter [Marinitenerispora sediminis]RCV53354.1 MFS transporter [Marinitenerispora sediminis]RCV57566.1 MFS transporter [Marinitenerispora sediminis]